MGRFGVNRNPFSLAQWHSENGGKHLPLIRALIILKEYYACQVPIVSKYDLVECPDIIMITSSKFFGQCCMIKF